MPQFKYDDITINYEIHGEGFPILLFAPGGMRSAISFWSGSEWNPIETLSSNYQVIAMDQRNAGSSRAPVSGKDDWNSYARDHLALLDHLGIERTHLLGGCIGGPYCYGVIQSAPSRVTAAILQQPIGNENNRDLFFAMFDSWAERIKSEHPEASEMDWETFRSNMFDRPFLYNTTREFVAQCPIPILVLMGSDPYHPESISREIARLSSRAQMIEQWKNPEDDNTVDLVRSFLDRHTPSS